METFSKLSTKKDISNYSGKIFSDTKAHHFWVRIYLEDTDAGGIVYHANYLKFTERARSEFLKLIKMPHNELMNDPFNPSMFVMQTCSISFLKPAFLDDLLEIRTTLKEIKGARISLVQEIFRHTALIVQLHLTLAYVKKSGTPVRLSRPILNAFKDFLRADF